MEVVKSSARFRIILVHLEVLQNLLFTGYEGERQQWVKLQVAPCLHDNDSNGNTCTIITFNFSNRFFKFLYLAHCSFIRSFVHSWNSLILFLL